MSPRGAEQRRIAARRAPAEQCPARALAFAGATRRWLAERSLSLPLFALSMASSAPALAQPVDAAPGAIEPAIEAAPALRASTAESVLLDRVAVRFTAPETGGIARPQFVFERELAFEARLEALADGGFRQTPETPYLERHVRAALERHMAEVLLEGLEITPEPTPRDLELRIRSARLTLQQQLGGAEVLEQASRAENISASEVEALLRRRARASLYLDRMVATMLTPSDTELRIVHRTTRTPFSGADYESVAPLLQRWYVAQRLNTAVRAFYEGARSRLSVTLLIGGAKVLPVLPGERSEGEPDTGFGER